MSTRSIDENNDWTFGRGKNDYRSGINEVAQNLKTRLQSFLGDCFFDVTAGIDWFNLLGAKSEDDILLAVHATILNTKDILNIVNVESELNRVTRNYSIRYEVITSYGRIDDSVVQDVDYLLTADGSSLLTEDSDPFLVE